KVDGTAGEIPGEPAGDDGLVAFLHGGERLDRVVVFFPGLSLPLFYGGQTFDRLSFIPHDGILGKALVEGLRITPVFGGNINGNGYWKINGHPASSCFLRNDKRRSWACCTRFESRSRLAR